MGLHLKGFDLWRRFIELELYGSILQYICTDEQIADVMTKILSLTKFVYFRDKLGIAKNASLAERE
jgi:hypothetical protein